MPPLAAYLTIPGFADIIKNATGSVLGTTYTMGMLWGIGGLTYGLGGSYRRVEGRKQKSEKHHYSRYCSDSSFHHVGRIWQFIKVAPNYFPCRYSCNNAILYGAFEGYSTYHMKRNIGLAWLQLPLKIPVKQQ